MGTQLQRAVRRGALAACAPRRALGQRRPRAHLEVYVRIKGVDAHIQRFACDQHTRPGTVVSKTQTISAATPRFQCFSLRWSAIWANPGTRQTRPPTTATFPRNTADKSPPQQHDVSILRLIGHVVLLGSYLARLGMPFSSARGPTIPSLGCLILTWTRYSESGQPRPRTEQRVNVRNRRPTCETAGSHAGRVGTQVAVAHGQSMTDHGAPTHRARCSIHRN